MIGKAGAPVTHVSRAYADRVEVRGRDLAGELMGQVTFTEYAHLLLTGEKPSEGQRYVLDLVLVALAEHGLMPTNVAARMTLAAAPDALQGAVAAGILGAGTVVLGTSALCAELLAELQPKVAAGEPVVAVATTAAREIREANGTVPGFGHPVHKPVDPRAERIFELAGERGLTGRYSELALALREAVAETWGKPLTLNVSMAIAAVMLDSGFSLASIRAVPILARTASLLAHLAEEEQQPLGFLMAARAEEAIEYLPPADA